MSNVRAAINALNDASTLVLQPLNDAIEGGGFNNNLICELPGVSYCKSRSPDDRKPLLVVLSRPNSAEYIASLDPQVASHKTVKDQRLIKSSQESLELLRNENVPREFVHTCLYYNSFGWVISEYTQNSDLFYFMKKHPNVYNLNGIKRLIGQIILGVSDLHDRDITHGDIKKENILVFVNEGKFIFKVSDLDGLVKVDSQGVAVSRQISGMLTKSVAAPELVFIDFQNNHRLCRKAIDCYAVGRLLIDINHFLLEKATAKQVLDFTNKKGGKCHAQADTIERELYRLIRGLVQAVPGDRLSMHTARQSKFFGNTSEERTLFFNELREEAANDLIIDGIAMNDRATLDLHFPLQSSDIKRMIRLSEMVLDAMQDCERQLQNHVSFAEGLEIYKKTFEINLVVGSIEKIKPDFGRVPASFKEQIDNKISTLTNSLREEKARLDYILLKKLPEIIVELMEESYKEFLQNINALLNVSPMFAPAILQAKTTSQVLKDQVVLRLMYSTNLIDSFSALQLAVSSGTGANTFGSFIIKNAEKLFNTRWDEIAKGFAMPAIVIRSEEVSSDVNMQQRPS